MIEASTATTTQESQPRIPTRRLALLLAFLARPEVEAILSQTPIRLADDMTISQALSLSATARIAADRYKTEAPIALEPRLRERASDVRSRTTYQRHYETQAEFEFMHVPIHALLTPQWNADLDYVDSLAATLPSEFDPIADFDFAFPQNTPPEPIINGNVAIFTSSAPNVAVRQVPVIRRDGEDLEIIARAEGRPNYVMVADLNGRLILENGVHHVLALAKRGRSQVAAVLKHVRRPEELAINRQSSLFTPETYFDSARPPLVRDFLTQLGIPAVSRSVVTVYRVAIQVEQIQVPDPQ